MSPTSNFAGSTGTTTTCCGLRMNGTIDEPLGRKVTVAPPATLPAIASNAPIRRSWQLSLDHPTD
ncbi:hypothetical protein GCM10010299_09500 [Streptomyces tanashiensis]|nr:hypothetical protein GCM10010299_09500 [Streptomyces tanashiensis]